MEHTSKLLPKLINYVFHGRWNVTKKLDGKKTVVGTKPFLSGLHYKLVNGRTRYHKDCLKRFETFVSLYDRNPSWTVFFDDKGEGSPPSSYLAAIEEELRNYTVDPFMMGRDALSSKKKWTSVAPWRKREAHVTLCRILLKRPAYRKWHDFLFADFVERNNLHFTFLNRHLPLSDGETDNHFKGLLKDPPHWGTAAAASKRKMKNQKNRTPLKKVKNVCVCVCVCVFAGWGCRYIITKGGAVKFTPVNVDKDKF